VLRGSMEYKLISQNSDKALTGERVQFSLCRPTLNSLRDCCPSREDRQRFYFMCQVPRILTTNVLFLEVLFWELLTVRWSTVSSKWCGEPFSVMFRPRDAYGPALP
jgi:hypothetical protein